MKGDLSRSRQEGWARPAGRGSSYHMGIWGESRQRHAFVVDVPKIRVVVSAGGGGATLIFCQGRGVGFVGGARPLYMGGCNLYKRSWMAVEKFFPSLKKRK